MNILIEGQSKKYLEKTHQWLDIALEEGLRFFVTALGKPDSFVEKIKKYDGVVFHNTTEKKWAQKAMQSNVDGFICVNNLAGGHAGTLSPKGLFEELKDLDLPMICAGGVGDRPEYIKALELGYAGVQVGTRFIASKESMASDSYKKAIVNSDKEDIVLTNHLTGIPVSVINTPYIQKVGTQHGGLMRFLLKHPKTKHYTRAFLSLKSFWALKKSMKKEEISKDYWQAGKSVEGIKKVISVNEIIQDWVRHS